jgi:hypothetical protein
VARGWCPHGLVDRKDKFCNGRLYAKGWTLADSFVNVGLAGCAAMCFCHRVLAATTEPALVRPTWPWMDGRGAAMRQEGRGLAHCRRRLRAAWHGSTVWALDAASCVGDALRPHCSRTACNTVGPLVAARDDLFGKRRGQSAADPQHEGARDAVPDLCLSPCSHSVG